MKRTWLFLVASLLCVLTLAWCKCKCPENELSEKAQYCLDNSGTYSHVISADEEYGECTFPSGVGCRDEILMTEECDFEPNLDDIDTEEERLAGCEENVQSWMIDFEEWSDNIVVEWWEESEWWASFVRNWVVKYVKDGRNWTMNAECVADFVDWSLSVSYDDAIVGDPVVEEEVEEEVEGVVIEEINEENTEELAEPIEEVIEEIITE